MRGGHANVTMTSISYHIAHAYTRACICTCTPTRSHACAYVRACMQASLHTSRPTFTRGRIHTCLHVHTYTHLLALPGRGVLPSRAYDLLFRSQAVACMLLINPSCVGACGKIEKGACVDGLARALSITTTTTTTLTTIYYYYFYYLCPRAPSLATPPTLSHPPLPTTPSLTTPTHPTPARVPRCSTLSSPPHSPRCSH